MQLAEQEKEITELRSLMAQKQDAKQVQRSLLSMLCAIICYTPRLLTTLARAFFPGTTTAISRGTDAMGG